MPRCVKEPTRARRRWQTARTLACALAATGAAAAEGGDTLTLAEAVDKALADGPEARIARLHAESAEHGHRAARAGYLPQVSLRSETGWSNRMNEELVTTDAAGNRERYNLATLGADRAWLDFHVSQVLLDLRRWHEIEREELAAEAARVAENRDRDEVVYEVTRRYARVVALQRKAEGAHRSLEQAEWLDAQAARLHDAGRVLEVDRELAGLHRTDAELAAKAVDSELSAARAELWLAIGEPEPLRVPLDPRSLPRVDPEAAASAAEAVASSPELRILDLRRRMQEASVAAARAGRLPTLSLATGYSHYGPERYDAYEDELWVGVDVEVPIFDSFRTRHEVARAEREAEIARLTQRQLLARKQAHVRDLAARIETGQAELTLAQRRAEAAGERLRLADLALRHARGDLAGAVAAREEHRRRAEDAIESGYAQVERWARLQRELGRSPLRASGPVAAAGPGATP